MKTIYKSSYISNIFYLIYQIKEYFRVKKYNTHTTYKTITKNTWKRLGRGEISLTVAEKLKKAYRVSKHRKPMSTNSYNKYIDRNSYLSKNDFNI